MHEMLQSYFDELYRPFSDDIKRSSFFGSNETYGEIYYYSMVKLLKYLNLTEHDHFLDIGSGLGKLACQVFLTTSVASVTGIEINTQRYDIASTIKDTIQLQLPERFQENRALNFFNGDFLTCNFDHISVIYVCSGVFSFDLLTAIGQKINNMPNVTKIATFRKLPDLDQFELTKKIFLHCSWEKMGCYLYSRTS